MQIQSIEMEGKNVEDALQKALKKLDTKEQNIKYEILNVGSKGLFNVIGVKPAKIKVSIINTYIDKAREFILNILKNMELEAEISIEEEKDLIKINLSGENMGLIIGYRGETLDSIQYLLSLVINKQHNIPHKKVILDTENYRRKREETLKNVAIKYANRVRKTGKTFKLEPMNPYERRIIHSALQNNEYIITHSEGEEPLRRVVISLK